MRVPIAQEKTPLELSREIAKLNTAQDFNTRGFHSCELQKALTCQHPIIRCVSAAVPALGIEPSDIWKWRDKARSA